MLIEVPKGARDRLRPLFEGFPGLSGAVDAILEGAFGAARADDVDEPTVAHLALDFDILAGDASSPAAEEAVRSLRPPASLAVSDTAWEPLLRRAWGGALAPYTRVEFKPGRWDRVRLRRFRASLPPGFALKRVTAADASRFAELADSLVYNFDSLEDFLARGVGFGVEHEGRFVSGCSSYAISARSLEFEIQTHPDYQRRGLATATASAMIEHCIERRLEPCWDAHNPISAALAEKLGFVSPAPYTAYDVRG